MRLQFEVPENCLMPKVVITGNYYGSKCFPSLNNLLSAYGTHPKQGGSMKKKFQKICCDEIREQLNGWKATKPIIIHYRFFEPLDGHYRDNTNVYYFAGKVFADALQDCKVIPNDNGKWLLNETHDFFRCIDVYDETRIEIYIEEVEDIDGNI